MVHFEDHIIVHPKMSYSLAGIHYCTTNVHGHNSAMTKRWLCNNKKFRYHCLAEGKVTAYTYWRWPGIIKQISCQNQIPAKHLICNGSILHLWKVCQGRPHWYLRNYHSSCLYPSKGLPENFQNRLPTEIIWKLFLSFVFA